MKPDISIVIPVFNDYARLHLCLQALVTQTGEHAIEIIVIDNGSTKIDQSIVKQYQALPQVQFISETKAGSYAARNKGLDDCTADIIAFTDSDCIPSENWISTALTIFENQKVDLVAGNIHVFTTSNATQTLLETYETVLAFPQKENARLGRSVTANLIMRKTVLDKIGKFKDDSFSGADHEYTGRAVAQGFNLIYGQDCIVAHPTRSKMSQMRQKLRRTVGGFYRLRKEDSSMAAKLSWKSILFDLPPPLNAWREADERKSELNLTTKQMAKVMLVAYHNKLYRGWLKVRLKLGLTGFIER
ncbi:glycosyltransferase family A protein [Alteromonadaceae bacterium BrNp21-10]|nr:glycosyltransferase family A protein [Alteromonadaceae bacterium BrNp21-10]